MPVDVVIPQLSLAMGEATVTEWHAASGDQVKEGVPLYSIESEKAVQEIEAPASGTLRIYAEAGSVCEVGAVIGSIT